MKLRFAICVTLVTALTLSRAQYTPPCGTDALLQKIFAADPAAKARLEQNWQIIDDYIAGAANRSNQPLIITIPVVFHVIHSGQGVGAGANISVAQLQSQIAVLNDAYRKRNADTVLVPNWFKSRVADVEVEFCLASTDPNGLSTTGITRHNLTYTQATFDAVVKPITQWDPTQYLNIWTALLTGNVLGYSTMANVGPANQDGVVLDYRTVGASPANPFSNSADTLGKTCVHEVGHWLGLFHTFQDSCVGLTPATCAHEGDRVCDTPPTKEANFGTPNLVQNTCHETPVDEYDMWMNYMDYADSKNLHMFTNGQRDVMRATLSTLRVSIQYSIGCTNPAAMFNYTGKVVDAATSQGLANARVYLEGPQGYEVTTDANGNFTVLNLYEGYYNVYAGKWGYMESLYSAHMQFTTGTAAVTIPLQNHHYYDDFLMNFGWTTSQNASGGFWQRAYPAATYNVGDTANPGSDVLNDFGSKCYVTGNTGGNPFIDNVDNGSVTLQSPPFDATGFTDPYIRYYRWFYDGPQSNNTPDDNMTIRLNDGGNSVTLEDITQPANRWTPGLFRLADFMTPTTTMRLLITVHDEIASNPNVVEGGLDRFEVIEAAELNTAVKEAGNPLDKISAYPNPGTGLGQLRLPENLSGCNVTVLNILGEEVPGASYANIHATAVQVDLTHQPPGFYVLRITSGQFEKNVKISIIR